MSNEHDQVDELMRGLDHGHKDAVEYLRSAILAADSRITEHVKWNAPSFCYDGVDRVTFQLKSPDVQLIMHRGAKVAENTVVFVDDSGLLDWRSGDRAVVTFSDLADVKAHEQAFIEVVKKWIQS